MLRKTTLSITALVAATLILANASAQENVTEQPADWAVADALETQIVLDDAVDINDVDVAVREGIAELTGHVDSLLAKERATHIAEMVRGVRAVSNRIDVVPAPLRWDSDIRSDVVHALLTDPATDSYEVDVRVDNGKVTLEGTVDSRAEMRLCTRVAMGVRGVTGIENKMTVDYKADRPDTEIKPELEKRMRWDVLIDDALVDVAVEEGRVTLNGTVGSAAEKRKAKDNAWVAGVKAVDASGVKVRPWAKDLDLRKDKYVAKSDDEIEDALKWAMSYDPRVLSFNVEPRVNLGWVTLTGTVDNLMAKKAAERLARHTVGVVGVSNRLKVRAPETMDNRSDREILEDVRRNLIVDPYTESYEITTRVKDGIVTLQGTVDSYFERAQAAEVASKVSGVSAVANLIRVAGATVYVEPEYSYPWYPAVTALPKSPRPDHKIKDHIEAELWWSPYVDADDVNVEVENDVATLTGTVDTWREYHAATDNAYQGGATSVVNKLKVR